MLTLILGYLGSLPHSLASLPSNLAMLALLITTEEALAMLLVELGGSLLRIIIRHRRERFVAMVIVLNRVELIKMS